MSPAAGGAAPAEPAVSAAVAPAAIAAPESGRAVQPQSQENPRDPAALPEGGDPSNAAARKTAWNVPPPPPTAAATSGIIGGEESWPALLESAQAWPKSASSDSLKSLSDCSAPSAPEDLIGSLLPSHPVSNPVSAGTNPTSTTPSNATPMASSQQNGSTNRPSTVRHGGSNHGNDGDSNGSSAGRSIGNNSSTERNGGSGGGGNWNDGVGGGRSFHSSNGDNNNRNGGGGAENNIRTNWTSNIRGGGGSNSGTGHGERSNRNGGGGVNTWNNNTRNGNGGSNGFGGRGGRNRRDHERGSSFSSRNYPRLSPVSHHHQQVGIYQPGAYHQPPPPPAHFMMPQPFTPYGSPFPYPADAQTYPFYIAPVDQHFQNMHLVGQPLQPLWVHQDQPSLQEDIRQQIEFYFSTNNLCHDTYLRRHMDEQGWVSIDLLAGFRMVMRFTSLGVDTNYILDAIRGSEILEVQGNNVRRRNDWAEWLLH